MPYYIIRVHSHLDPSWESRLAQLRIEHQDTGTTLITGYLPDQAALHGVLLQIMRLSLTLLSLETREMPGQHEAKKGTYYANHTDR